MSDLQLVEGVFCLFVVRVGLPGLLLVSLGIYIAHWQSKRQSRNNAH